MEKEFIGLTKKQALEKAKNQKMVPRIIHENGYDFLQTQEFRLDRLNFKIQKDIVTECYIG